MMRLFSSMLLSFLLILVGGPLLTTCSTAATPDAAAAVAATAAVQSQGGLVRRRRRRRRFSRLGFYESRPDYYRKCPFPYCGGAFVRPIDGSLMTCPGATEPTVECYVGGMRYPPQTTTTNSTIVMKDQNEEPPLLFDETVGMSIIYGRIVPGNYTDAPDINDFFMRNGTGRAALATTRSQQNMLYYSVQRDYRKCASPLCGGYWLTALATAKTLCADGSVADESCYVASLNLSGLNSTPDIVDGSSVRGYYIGNRNYATTSWPDLKDLLVLEASGSAPCAECDTSNNSSQVCLDDPSDDCTFCGCPTICKNTKILCGGFGGFECPADLGLTCIDDPDDDCDPDCGDAADCSGICVDMPSLEYCGGFTAVPCANAGFECVDQKGDECSSTCNGGGAGAGADCSGICIRRVAGAKCGGIAGIACANGFDCVHPLDSSQECGTTTCSDCEGVCILSSSSSSP